MPIATLTTRGRVTIPAEVRNRLRIETRNPVEFVFLPNGEVVLRTKRIPFDKL